MQLSRQAALAIALVCGLLAAVGVWVWIGQQKKPVPKAPETIEVPAPIQTLPAQTDLMPEMFKKVTMQKTQVAANVVINEADLVGRVSRVELLMDKPVLAEQVAVRSNALGLAYTINRGQRAMSVALDMVAAVCDFVQAGDRVDVVATFGREGKVVVRTLVQDVLVLATGTATNQKTPPAPPAATPGAAPPPAADPNPPKRPDMPFTLALTPEQAQIIIAADTAGKLRLLSEPFRARGGHA
ncbi:MAG: Flp pilus assembly protein CpaB, partial [Armatimonadota bacterium]